MRSLVDLCDPESGARMIQKVYRGEEIYQGSYQKNGPDLVAVPFRGYDLKGNLSADRLTFESKMEGMHTDDDAFLYIRNHPLKKERPQIIDLYPTILSLMRISPDHDADGVSLIS